jgi:hypothetical protein
MIKIDQYTVIEIRDNGQYGFQILEGWVDKDGNFKPNFCKREYGKDKVVKTVPVSVKLGDKAKALEALKLFIATIEGGFTDDGIPF